MHTLPMPPDFREVYEALRTEATWLHARWISYSQLFARSERREALLNECAPSLFYFIHETLLNDLLLTLCKLTDPASQGKDRENLSLERLQNLLEQTAEPILILKCKATLAAIDTYSVPLKVLRNKYLAHLDLTVALNKAKQPLLPVAIQQIDEALRLIRNYLNGIEIYYNDNEWGYENFLMLGTDGDALVHVLRDGLRYEQLVKQDVIPYDDFQNSPWIDA